MNIYRLLFSLSLVTLVSASSYAQLDIPEDNQLYRVRVTRQIDLREKQNKGFFAKDREVTKYILEGISDNKLTVYRDLTNEGLVEPQADSLVSNLLSYGDTPPLIPYSSGLNPQPNEIISYNGRYFQFIGTFDPNFPLPAPLDASGNVDAFAWTELPPTSTDGKVFEALDIRVLELVEDVIFDKVRSRLYHDIVAIRLVVPGERYKLYEPTWPAEQDYPIGYVDFTEVEKEFRANDEAKWINRYNPREWKNLADAFLLRLFSGPIIKYENPDDLYIRDMFIPSDPGYRTYNGVRQSQGAIERQVLMDIVNEMQRYELFLMEKEHNLWEY